MHARTGRFGPASIEVLNWMAKDSAPRLAQETGQALGLVRAQHAMRSAARAGTHWNTTDDALMRFLQRECLTLRLATAFSARALRSGCGLTAFPWSRDTCSESEPP
eukprot:5275990-Amphidinium_carterae.2